MEAIKGAAASALLSSLVCWSGSAWVCRWQSSGVQWHTDKAGKTSQRSWELSWASENYEDEDKEKRVLWSAGNRCQPGCTLASLWEVFCFPLSLGFTLNQSNPISRDGSWALAFFQSPQVDSNLWGALRITTKQGRARWVKLSLF